MLVALMTAYVAFKAETRLSAIERENAPQDPKKLGDENAK